MFWFSTWANSTKKKRKKGAFVKSVSTDANINTLYDIHEHKHVATSPTGNVSCYTWQTALYKTFRMLAHITCTWKLQSIQFYTSRKRHQCILNACISSHWLNGIQCKNYSSSKIWVEVAVLKPPEFEWDPHIPELLTGFVKKETTTKQPCHQQQITLYTTPKLQVSSPHHYLQDENGWQRRSWDHLNCSCRMKF